MEKCSRTKPLAIIALITIFELKVKNIVKLLSDFFPIIFFFAAFKYGESNPSFAVDILQTFMSAVDPAQAPVLLATLVAIVCTFIQVGLKYARGTKPEPALWISLVIIVVFGSLTLWLHNEWFIKCKPTILYWVFALILGYSLVTGKLFIKRLMGKELTIPDAKWKTAEAACIVFLFLVGIANLLVAYFFPTDVWVNFKLFGLMALTFIFTIGLAFWILKNAESLQQ